MNGWDIFTWFNAAALCVGTGLIFIFFLRDARGVLEQGEKKKE